MSKVYTSAVVIVPPEEKWLPIQEIRRQYDRQINRWMPHITLLYPFRPEEEYIRIEDLFSNVCSGIERFEITFKNFRYFPHSKQNYTFWLDPIPKQPIIDLQAKILELVPECDDANRHKSGFSPHLSVGQIKGRDKMKAILGTLQNNWKEVKFSVNQICFISREKNNVSKFEIKKRIELK